MSTQSKREFEEVEAGACVSVTEAGKVAEEIGSEESRNSRRWWVCGCIERAFEVQSTGENGEE